METIKLVQASAWTIWGHKWIRSTPLSTGYLRQFRVADCCQGFFDLTAKYNLSGLW